MRQRIMLKYRWNDVLKGVCLLLLLIFLFFPIVWIFMMSLKTRVDIISYTPKFIFKPTLMNYRTVLGAKIGSLSAPVNFPHYFNNSVILTFGSILITFIVGLPIAYVLARIKFLGSESLAFTFLTFRFAPVLAIIFPLYVIYRYLHIYNTYAGLIIAYQFITLPLCIWFMRSYFLDIPKEIEEAALMDGCGRWQTFVKIALPIAKPGLVSIILLLFIYSWNNLVIGMILGGKKTAPVTVGILNYVGYHQALWGEMAAALIITMIPGAVISIFVQKHIVRGLSYGAIK